MRNRKLAIAIGLAMAWAVLIAIIAFHPGSQRIPESLDAAADGSHRLGALNSSVYGYRTVQQAGTSVAQRDTINFTSGATVTDDDANGVTVVSVTGGGGDAGSLAPLAFFSPVTVMEGIDTAGHNQSGGGHFIRFNTGNPPGTNVGIPFHVTNAGHSCLGGRWYWLGFDNANECTSTVHVELWDSASAAQLAIVNASVTSNGEYSATFASPVSLSVGIIYILSIYDAGGGGSCDGGAGGKTSYTYLNSLNIGTTLGAMLSGGGTPIIGGPWAWFVLGGTPDGGGGAPSTIWMQNGSFGDFIPNSVQSLPIPIEPVLQ